MAPKISDYVPSQTTRCPHDLTIPERGFQSWAASVA
jgi:hypothetical protein